ncbi:chromatin-remodelling complex, RSC SWI/SNF subunit Rsc7/Swp82, partial [Thamnocephalis sphaerospora]
EHDELGEKKVDRDGYLADGREYAVPAFAIGTKHPRRLYMLAKEPSALLGFRDSYVFFMRNPDLKRVDANEEDRGYMDRNGLLPNTLRKRNILLVSARSVFKKFGHLVVHNGRRWKDDYF